jgi:hypothetical protein
MELSPFGGAFGEGSFDSKEVNRLTEAFARSGDALKFAYDDPNSSGARVVREALASKLLELAKQLD